MREQQWALVGEHHCVTPSICVSSRYHSHCILIKYVHKALWMFDFGARFMDFYFTDSKVNPQCHSSGLVNNLFTILPAGAQLYLGQHVYNYKENLPSVSLWQWRASGLIPLDTNQLLINDIGGNPSHSQIHLFETLTRKNMGDMGIKENSQRFKKNEVSQHVAAYKVVNM